MALTGWPEQVRASAANGNGDVTVTFLPGVDTLTPLVVPEVAPTVTVTSVTQEAPELAQALTCRVCAPVVAVTVALMTVPLTMVVLLLLSSENPIAETG